LRLLYLINRSTRAISQEQFSLFFRVYYRGGTDACVSGRKPIPALAVCLVPVNFVSYVTGWIAFDNPSGCRPQPRLVSQMALFPFKVQVANHEQGRVNLPVWFNQRTQMKLNQDSCQAVVFEFILNKLVKGVFFCWAVFA
jgi:hypothetical protein